MRRKKIFGQRCGKGRVQLALVKDPDRLVVVGYKLLSGRKIKVKDRKKCAKKL